MILSEYFRFEDIVVVYCGKTKEGDPGSFLPVVPENPKVSFLSGR